MIGLSITIIVFVIIANVGLICLLNISNKRYNCTIEEIDHDEFTETKNIDII